MKNQEKISHKKLNNPNLEYAKQAIDYMKISTTLLYILIAVLLALGLYVFSIFNFNETVGLIALIVGIIGVLIAIWKFQTVFGLYLTGIAGSLAIGGFSVLVIKDSGFLWIPATTIVIWALWKFTVYSKVSTSYKAYHNMGSYSNCQISFFRPFDSRYAEFARNLVIPLLKNYGKVEHVNDDFFKDSSTKGVLSLEYENQTKEVLSKMDEYDQATRDMIKLTKKVMGTDMLSGIEFDDLTWKDGVLRLLERTDIAVIDVSTISENILWELENCFRFLPSMRVILVAGLHAINDIKSHQNNLINTLQKCDINEFVPMYFYGGSNKVTFKFADDIHSRMIAIASY
jgi:hypothetical protein